MIFRNYRNRKYSGKGKNILHCFYRWHYWDGFCCKGSAAAYGGSGRWSSAFWVITDAFSGAWFYDGLTLFILGLAEIRRISPKESL